MQLTDKQKAEGWRIVKFGDVAQEVKVSTKDPLGEGIERYIGLEHINPESLRLTRYGLIAEDNPTFTKKFSTGDILFGRRRAYLKKAAVADFDGICSGDITVIASKGNDLVPDLLPFIVQSEPFFDWAIKHSAGGLSPRTKFKSLAEFEFPLPPRSRQEEMLEVYFRIENSLSKNKLGQEATLKAKNILFHDFASKSSGDKTVVLGDCLLRTPEYGANMPAIELSKNTYKYIRITDINSDGSLDQSVAAGAVRNKNDKYLLDTDDILIARTGATVGKPFLYNFERHGEAIFAGYLLRLRFEHSKMLPQYFKHYTDTKRYWHWVEINARGAAQPNINAKQLEKIKLMDVSVNDQLSICKSLNAFYKEYEELKDAEAKIVSLRKNYTNQYLNGEAA
jgi:type I restriction enzyme S subunit